MVKIDVSGQTVLVDECDLDLVKKHKWSINPSGYVVSYNSSETIRLHRYILGLHTESYHHNRMVDHKDGDPLNLSLIHI